MSDTEMTENGTDTALDIKTRMAVDIVSSYVSRNPTTATDLPDVIRTVFGSLSTLDKTPGEAAPEKRKPAVPIKKSITPDYLICLEDGRKMKMLKRHLRTSYGLTPDEYRARWGLGADYPMVAPNYAEQRSQFAKTIGLGRKSVGRK
ncbi:MAG: MucR family transcriptional regulator [Magnetovibrionaceae bacterium]